jgi:hypothetical protein
MIRFSLLAALLLFAAQSGRSDTLRLGLPLDCVPGESCFIQNFVDTDPGPDAVDFACGGLTYDGHKGTDFALVSRAAMAEGVTVRAAAPGVVRASRDGMADTGRDGTMPEDLDGRECGNGVVIDHGGGWESQYCHLKAGSVSVARGARVATGTPLGEVGYSGLTETPHLHLSLRKDGTVVDPFAPDGTRRCDPDARPGDTLWADPITYVPGGLIALGAAAGVPAYDAIKAGRAGRASLPADAPALVGWAYLFGARAGDVVEIVIEQPDGAIWHRHDIAFEKPFAQAFRASGKRRPADGWQVGEWTISARMIRDGAAISGADVAVTIRP